MRWGVWGRREGDCFLGAAGEMVEGCFTFEVASVPVDPADPAVHKRVVDRRGVTDRRDEVEVVGDGGQERRPRDLQGRIRSSRWIRKYIIRKRMMK